MTRAYTSNTWPAHVSCEEQIHVPMFLLVTGYCSFQDNISNYFLQILWWMVCQLNYCKYTVYTQIWLRNFYMFCLTVRSSACDLFSYMKSQLLTFIARQIILLETYQLLHTFIGYCSVKVFFFVLFLCSSVVIPKHIVNVLFPTGPVSEVSL
jgi:hypothetical protein